MSCNEEKIDFKEEIEKLLKYLNHSNKLYGNKVRDVNNLLKLACEEQKKLCAENANMLLDLDKDTPEVIDQHEIFAYDAYYVNGNVTINRNSILNSPTVKFD